MVITYHGGECFKIVFGGTTLALNPVAKESKLKSVRFGADIALVSLNHPDFNGTDQVGHGEKQPFVISGSGEYEVGGVFVRGFPSASLYGGGKRLNTIYSIRLEGMNLCFLGALSNRDLPGEIVEDLGSVDVLFVPIGGEGVLSAADAHALAVRLEPAIEIPMHYPSTSSGQSAMGKNGALETFLKEEGVESCKPIDKLTLKKKDLEGKEGDVVVLQG